MANSKTSLTDVGAASGQLKSKFSLLEKTQIDALGGTSGSLSSGAGLINGSVILPSNLNLLVLRLKTQVRLYQLLYLAL
jgi:hypothetical protein